MNRLQQTGILIAACCAALFGTRFATAITLDWTRQLGTTAADGSFGVSADGLGSVYIAGITYGSFSGLPHNDNPDVFVSKYDASGAISWTRQVAIGDIEICKGVSADGLGSVYISGWTRTDLAGGQSPLTFDAFIAKYNSAGNLLWTRVLKPFSGQNGPNFSAYEQYGLSVSADGLGNAYISGYTFGNLDGPNAGSRDAFVTKYDTIGNQLWTRQLGTSLSDKGNGISADGLGNVYLLSATEVDLGVPSYALLSKYDAVGSLLWTRQLGTSGVGGNGVSADRLGNIYITGGTGSDLGGPSAGDKDAYVAKYDAAGNLLWTRQFGTPSSDEGLAVSSDGLGGVYFSGITNGGLGGPSSGSQDAFVGKYDGAGNLLWVQQFGTTESDGANGVSADHLGHLYVSGGTGGSLGGTAAGGGDAFVVRFNETAVPEPSTAAMLTFSVIFAHVHFARRARKTIY